MLIAFWVLVCVLVYSYLGYGLLILLLARLRTRRTVPLSCPPLTATLLISAHNEIAHIENKLRNALSLDIGPHSLQIVVVSDGSSDGTERAAEKFADQGVRTFVIEEHVGKIGALNKVMTTVEGDVVIFSDANSVISNDAIKLMLNHFADPDVGGVCGCIGVSNKNRGLLARGEALFWKYDHMLKISESEVSSAVSAQGSLYAVRRALLDPIPSAVADDLFNSLQVIAKGKRLVFEPAATVVEDVSSSTKAEFGRRVRSTERGWRGLMLMSRLMNPFKFGIYSLQIFSHKFLRRINPFLLILLFAANVAVLDQGWFYVMFFGLQVFAYAVALLGFLKIKTINKLTTIPHFFVVGHAAMAMGLINVFRGTKSDRWKPVR